MRILCDIGHPAHVHLFKHVLWELDGRGHQYLITTRDKDITLHLLKAYEMPYVSLGRHHKHVIGKVYGIFKFDLQLYSIARKFGPDIFISHGSIYAAQVSRLLGKPHVSMEDTGNMEQIRLYRPFTDAILTSKCFTEELGRKQIRYDGYHELAYLSPHYFKPDPSVLKMLGVKPQEKYVILRFISWHATHDIAHTGISLENKVKAVEEFSKYAKVFISSERALPGGLEKYRIDISPEHMHDALYYAALLYGESGTMASECAVLGTPAIFLDNVGRGYTNEQEEKYGLVHNYTEAQHDQDQSIMHGIELLKQSDIRQKLKERRDKLLKDKIDVTAFLLWFIPHYPKSAQIMRENADFQLRFKRNM